MNLTEIRNILNDEDIMLTKSLGQTFMHDQNQLRKIVGLAKLSDADRVIEIAKSKTRNVGDEPPKRSKGDVVFELRVNVGLDA